jgi:hypothetical protein
MRQRAQQTHHGNDIGLGRESIDDAELLQLEALAEYTQERRRRVR